MVFWSLADSRVGPERPVPEPIVPAPERGQEPALRRGAGRHELWSVRLLVALSTVLFGVFVWLAVQAVLDYGWAMLPFALMIGGLFYCALAYQVIRLGAAVRRARPATATIPPEALMGQTAPSVTVLIPSYQESRRVLIETVLSAALATYRNKQIVVLVDDPPNRPGPLAESLGAIADVRAWIAEGEAIRRAALEGPATALRYAEAHDRLADWLREIAVRLKAEADPSFAHVDRFVTDRIVLALAARHEAEAQKLRSTPGVDLAVARDRLEATAAGEIVSFQRKRFGNLSHAANKAMNLNAYLGLMGRDWRSVADENGLRLEPVAAGQGVADLSVPMPDYVLTLDADSVIVSDYILTLVGILEASPKAAVAQTPYLTFPHGLTPVERIAGATTDIQYLIHQGSSHYGAAYWVGANAIIRRRALEDIRSTRQENGHEVVVFVQDKTVIEDTGSTIDLQDKGWHVHNHFEPLAYSATPADFGALAIQRKRWANGGLILFFDLLRSQWRQGGFWRKLPQLFVRSHYLLSPLIGNVGILVLMLMSAQKAHPMFWAPLFMTPYFLLYMADLRRMGYHWRDLFGVCALNLMLLPVNLAGILASVWQMAGGRRRKFLRTPKLASRTVVPPYAFVFNLGILALMVAYVVMGLQADQPYGVVIPLINIVLYSYGLWRFVGLGAGFADLGSCLAQEAGRAVQGLWRPLRSATALPAFATACPVPTADFSIAAQQSPLCRAAVPQVSEEDR